MPGLLHGDGHERQGMAAKANSYGEDSLIVIRIGSLLISLLQKSHWCR